MKAKAKSKESKKKESDIRPLGSRVLVDPGAEEENDEHKKTASGIYIPGNMGEEKPEQGTVVAVGPGTYDDGELISVSVKVGDKVIFSKYGYDEIKVDGKKLYIIKEENILAVVK